MRRAATVRSGGEADKPRASLGMPSLRLRRKLPAEGTASTTWPYRNRREGGGVAAEQGIRLTGAEDARRFIDEGGHAYVKVGVADVDGVLRGKYIARDKFFSALEKGFGFCDVIVGWDSNDQLYDNVIYTG